MKCVRPKLRRGAVDHGESEDRKDDQDWIHAWIETARALLPPNGSAQDVYLVERDASKDTRSQRAAFVEHLSDPHRRNPWHLLDAVEKSLDDSTNQHRGRRVDRYGIPNMADDRRHSFVYDRVEQVFAIVEVVVQHRGRQHRLLGNHRECCRGDAFLGEEFNRR
jgi:hypothetical protein